MSKTQSIKHKKSSETLSKKSFTMPKKLNGEPFGIFQHPFCRKTPEKIEGDLLGKICFPKRLLTMPKKLKGGLFSLARYCMLRGKAKNPFDSVR